MRFQRMRQTLRIFAVVAIVAGFALAAWAYAGGLGGDTTIYRFSAVQRGTLTSYTVATGRIEAVDVVEVSSQLSGQVAELLADFNDNVKSGRPLARLDDKTYEAAVVDAKARLAQARGGAWCDDRHGQRCVGTL